MKMPTSKRFLILCVVLAGISVLGIVSPPEVSADFSCGGYASNSSIVFFFGYGWACAGTGPGCRECVEWGSMGYTVCLESGSRNFCYDYQY